MAANSKTVTAPGTISPKVFYPLVVAVVLTFLGTFLAAITPETLSGLGAFAVPMSLSLAAIAQVITGYLKRDELRDLGVEATAAVIAVPPTSQVTPPLRPVADYNTGGDADYGAPVPPFVPGPVDDAAAGDLLAETDAARRIPGGPTTP